MAEPVKQLSKSTNAAGETSEGLNFDAAPALTERSEAPAGAQVVSVPVASGLSVLVAIVALLASFSLAKGLTRRGKHVLSPLTVAPAWHLLSFLVASFLGLNVFFGGLTALLLNGVQEDAQSYFAEISALKLARLSHEHFFGYGLSFGVIAALALFFVATKRKRVLLPVLASFAFALLDASSWWMARYVSFGFHTLSFLTGGVFALSFLALYVQIARVNLGALRRAYFSDTKEF